MGRAKVVTPTLFIGDELDLEHVVCTTTSTARKVILEGGTALVPSWDVAEGVLLSFQVDRERLDYIRASVQE